jgi:hypothetical protein
MRITVKKLIRRSLLIGEKHETKSLIGPIKVNFNFLLVDTGRQRKAIA